MTRPVVFLDVDGVLNVNRMSVSAAPLAHRRDGRPYRPAPVRRYSRQFSTAAVAQLDRLAVATGALFVLSSSWRLEPDARQRLAGHGVEVEWHREWRTDDLGDGRGAQIARWLATNGSPRHVIVDDWPHELHQHAGRVVRTDQMVGLTRADADRVVALLSQQRALEKSRA